MHCYAIATFLVLGATHAAAFLPARPIHFRNHLPKSLGTDDILHFTGQYSPSTRSRISLWTSIHCNKRVSIKNFMTASEGSDDAEGTIVTGVTLKMAFDSSPVWGVADLSETKSERFTSPDSLDMVHRLRRDSCAVLVGRSTVERDDCSLTVRRVELGKGESQPVRVILDPSSKIVGGDYTILKDGLPTIIYHLQTEGMADTVKVSSDSVTLVGLNPSNVGDGFSLSPLEVVEDLKARGLQHVMVEGGPVTARAFLEVGVVDRAILVRAPIEFEIPVPSEMDLNTLTIAGLQMIGTAIMGGDNVEYWTKEGLPWPKSELPMWP